jgi:hypothetical protein
VTCTEAIDMLRTWKEAYYCVRLKIEQSGREQRWEFDKKKLFGEADYIASVAKDMFDIAKVPCLHSRLSINHCLQNTECFKKSFAPFKAYVHLFRGHAQCFELS